MKSAIIRFDKKHDWSPSGHPFRMKSAIIRFDKNTTGHPPRDLIFSTVSLTLPLRTPLGPMTSLKRAFPT